jgi:hypothetical protein
MKRTAGVLVALLIAGCAGMQGGPGWTTLLDGPNGFDNWNRIGNANWRVVEGVVQADSGEKGRNHFLMTRQPYGDFMLRVEFWASDDANSGIYMRCTDLANVTDKTCYEANIFDQRPDPKFATGAIVHLSAIDKVPKTGGKWNTYEITARGSRLTVVLNGVRTAETDQATAPGGPIGLQWANGVVKFRKVEIKPL